MLWFQPGKAGKSTIAFSFDLFVDVDFYGRSLGGLGFYILVLRSHEIPLGRELALHRRELAFLEGPGWGGLDTNRRRPERFVLDMR